MINVVSVKSESIGLNLLQYSSLAKVQFNRITLINPTDYCCLQH